VHEPRELLGVDETDVGALDHADALIATKAGVQLTPANVEGDHSRRAALEEAVREAARRRSGVEGRAIRYVDGEALEGRVELLTAPAHETGRGRRHHDLIARRHETSRLVGRGTVHEHAAGRNGLLGLAAGLDETPADQLGVESAPGGGAQIVACPTRPRGRRRVRRPCRG
jgi:hypothetical protein